MDNIVIKLLKAGKVGVIPTDTIYGLVGSAMSKEAVEKIYKIKKRDRKKPFIILIGSQEDLKLFGIDIGLDTKKELKKYWPGPVSILLECKNKKFFYLHRGTNKLFFRLPKDKKLIGLIRKTGPLVAPSANLEGKKPAEDMIEVQKYFGDQVDFYVDGGKIVSRASRLIEIENGKLKIWRK